MESGMRYEMKYANNSGNGIACECKVMGFTALQVSQA